MFPEFFEFLNRMRSSLYEFTGDEFIKVNEYADKIRAEINDSLLKRPETTSNWIKVTINKLEPAIQTIHHVHFEQAREKARKANLFFNEMKMADNQIYAGGDVWHELRGIQADLIEALLNIDARLYTKDQGLKNLAKEYLPPTHWIFRTFPDSKEENQPEPDPPPKKEIEISPSVIPDLFDCLKDYFEKEELSILESLLKGEKLEGRLNFKKQQNQLAEVFFRLKEKGLLSNTIEEASVWMASNFTYRNKSKQVNCKFESIKNVFSKPDKRPKQHKTICNKLEPI